VGAPHAAADHHAPGRLAVRTVPVDDPGDLVARLPDPGALAWVRHGDGLVGWGEAARLTLPAGEDRFTAGEKWLGELFDEADVADEVAVPGSGLVAFGSFTFDPASGSGPSGPPPEAQPVIPPAEVRWSDGSRTALQWEQAVARRRGPDQGGRAAQGRARPRPARRRLERD
jgi:menaquinone-specific isochorismate synthase